MGDQVPEPVAADGSSACSAGPGAPPPDPARFLYAARAFRDFGDGFVAVLLAVFLTELGFGAFQVGVIATAALLGSSLMTLAIGLFGRPGAQRHLLLAASTLMVLTGVAFAAAEDFGWLVLVAIVGTINPSAGSASLFVPMEHALLAGSSGPAARTRRFAIYSTTGALAAAAGALAAGSPDILVATGWTRLEAIKAMFIVYAVLGVAGGVCYRLIPSEVSAATAEPRRPRYALGPSRRVVLRLAALFSVDAFAGGLVVQSLLALWLFQKFEMSLAAAGTFFFWAGLLAALSYAAAAWLAGRIGLLNTMVYTHIPSSLCLIGAALVPDRDWALALLLARSALSQMDVPTRSSYVMAIVTPEERAAAASVTSVPRGLAASASPALAGALFAAGHAAWPLVLCGVLKILYDLALLWGFRHVRPPEESAKIA